MADANTKRRRGPKSYLTESARKRKRKETEQKRRQARIYIRQEIDRWRTMKEELGLLTDSDLAKLLLDRPTAYDRNKNFGQTENLEPEFKMTLPDASSYLDLNSDSTFPGTTLENLTSYLARYDKQLDKQIQQNYNEQTIRFYRLSRPSDNESEFYYIKSSCYAEYRKGITYEVDIMCDKNGCIIEAQCECTAGEGPGAHCKHVSTVLYASVMLKNYRRIKVEETCTQKLQSFHKCKKFLGSPLKSQNIDMPGADEFTNLDFDPRPENFRNAPGYYDYFRNTCLNFPGVSEMPIFQIFEPANAYAVASDHDYLRLAPEDNFLEKIGLLNITQEKINAVEQMTRGQSSINIWKIERTMRITSSMYGRICKATVQTDMAKLANSLLTVSEIKAAPLEHGLKYESTALQQYTKDTGNMVNVG